MLIKKLQNIFEFAAINEYERLNGKPIHFLERPMFENYLLDAEAITATLNEIPEVNVTVAEIQHELDADRGEESIDLWLTKTHGANLLEKIFDKRSCPYRKTTHSVELTKWLLQQRPGHFDELRTFVIGVLDNNGNSQTK